MRGFDGETGEECVPVVEALESDYIVTEGNFIMTRCGQGAAVLVWKRPSGFA